MKKTSYLKTALLQATFATAILLMASCETAPKADDTKEVAEDKNEEKFNSNSQENDAQFLVNAAEINLEKIELAKLAQQKGSTPHIKELGKMMKNAHTKSLNDLTTLAKSKNISIPTAPTENAKDAYNKLNEKSGSDFDEAFADMMVNGHKDAIDIFEKASTDCKDADIKNWASASLPGLRTHFDHSIDSQNKFDKK